MYKLNLELTRKLYEDESIKGLIKLKECYNNCFRVVSFSSLASKFQNKEIKVGLSYVLIDILNIWVRHCVLINEKDEIIDLTIMTCTNKQLNREYKIIKTFDCEEYLECVEATNNNGEYRADFPDLKEEYDFYCKEKQNDIYFQIAEEDYIYYIMPLLKKYGAPK